MRFSPRSNPLDVFDGSIRAAIDQCLSGADRQPSLCYRVLEQTKGVRPMKRKLSLGLVMVLAVAILTISAAALSLQALPVPARTNDPIQQPVSPQHWPDSARVELVYELLKLDESLHGHRLNAMKQCSGAAAAQIADELLQSYYTSQPVRVPGDNRLWRYDLKAQETYLMRLYGSFSERVHEAYLMPSEDDMGYEQALETARQVLRTHFSMPPEFPEGMAYALDAAFVQLPGAAEPIWRIRWWSLRDGGAYAAELSRSGQPLRWSTPYTDVMYDADTDLLAEGYQVAPLPGQKTAQEILDHALRTVTEIGGYDEHGLPIGLESGQLGSMTCEAALFYHPEVQSGWIPVWQVTLRDGDTLVARQLYSFDGSYLCTAFGARDFSCTQQDDVSSAMYLATFEDAFMTADAAEKARLAALYRPHAEAILRCHPDWPEMDCALYEISLLQRYAAPSPGALGLAQAEDIALREAARLGADKGTLSTRSVYNAFLLDQDGRETWRITVAQVDLLQAGVNSMQYVNDPALHGIYVVHMDAFTGEVLDAFEGVTALRPCQWRY